jgi:stage V sporulation protein D (sporulation-specific penicillin-binding protein)
MNKEIEKTTFRIRLLLIGTCAVSFVLFVRLFYIQVLHTDEFKQIASGQYQAPKEGSYDRGSIFFQDKGGKELSAATRVTAYTLAISPRDIVDGKAVYEKLSAAYPSLDKALYEKKLEKKKDPYEEIAKKLTLDEKKKIEVLKLRGVQLVPEYYREYPYKENASQVLGFVGFSGDKLLGRYGLERYYNDVLSRSDEGVYVNFFAEIFSDIGKTLFSNEREREGDLVLTIEPNVQLFVEDELRAIQKKWQSESVGIIVMDPNTGKILAMGSTPGFDPNDIKNAEVKNLGNPLVENVYEMGSIIKPLTVAAGLDSGAITKDSRYYDVGDLVINGSHVRNYDKKARGDIEVQQILSQSLNVGTVHVARKMGGEKFRKYMLDYGLGDATGIDLPNEATSLVDNLRTPKVEVDYLTTAFGQGMAISPVQTIRALAVLGNGGKLVTPYVVDKIDYKAGFSKKIVQNDPKQVLTEKTSQEITQMLVTVVDKALKGGKYKIPEYSVAAKTGTAQMVNQNNGKYYDDRYLHSFFGYFPAYKPKFIVLLYHTWPKGAKYASDTLTDPFFDITKFLLNYYEVPPDREVPVAATPAAR